MDGLLLIDKPSGFTSHDVVQKTRRILGQKKIGHCGTLDPAATGLLLLTLGKATRLTRFLINAPKIYDGTIRFGLATDTYDADGEVTAEAPTDGVDDDAIAAGMERLVGTIEHAAPPYSAKKVKGKKLYELARKGEEVPRETKQVTVYDFVATSALGEPGEDRITFRLECASGTYARTLAHDLGQDLGSGAHLESLRRLQIGPFRLEDAVTLETLEAHRDRLEAAEAGDDENDENDETGDDPAATAPLPEGLGTAWVPFDHIPLPFDHVVTDATQENRIVHGQTVLVRDLEGEEGDWIKVMNRREELIAVGTVAERIGSRGVAVIQPRVVFKTA